jgi:trans-2,3-dihydro-3-hydroxyanthranilate isomerase
MNYSYFICDVFSDRQFGGNQLAVFPEASGLSSAQMQSIAREFNFAETTFVLPPQQQGHTCQVRIFTPARELPFAGHPNLGTAFILASQGFAGDAARKSVLYFEEEAGIVPVSVEPDAQGRLLCELTAPQPLSLGAALDVALVSRSLSLEIGDIVTRHHPPQTASVGVPFVMVELQSRSALERARANMDGCDQLAALGVTPALHLYVRSNDDFDIRARMFAPEFGIVEDAATGSANCALAGLLAALDPRENARLAWRIAQGVEMGRPSLLLAGADKHDGKVTAVRIAGYCALFARGEVNLS